MEVFDSVRGICRHAGVKYNRLATVRDRNSPRCKFRLMECYNDVVRVTDLLCGQGTLQLVKRDSIVIDMHFSYLTVSVN